MPKPVKKQASSRSKDVNEIAFDLVRQTAALTEPPAVEPPTFKAQLSAYMAKLGAKGGKVGGKRRLKTMTSEERSEAARRAACARWRKR